MRHPVDSIHKKKKEIVEMFRNFKGSGREDVTIVQSFCALGGRIPYKVLNLVITFILFLDKSVKFEICTVGYCATA